MGGRRSQPIRKGVKLRRQPGITKLKSHQGAMKRFFQLPDGTFMHKAAGKKHLQAGKSRRRQTLRKLHYKAITTKGIIKKLRRLMPYGATRQVPKPHVHSLFWERPEGWTEAVAASKKPKRATAAR